LNTRLDPVVDTSPKKTSSIHSSTINLFEHNKKPAARSASISTPTGVNGMFKKNSSTNYVNAENAFVPNKPRESVGSIIALNNPSPSSTLSTINNNNNKNDHENDFDAPLTTTTTKFQYKTPSSSTYLLDLGKKILKRVNSGNQNSFAAQRKQRRAAQTTNETIMLDPSLTISLDKIYVKNSNDIKEFEKELINLPEFTIPSESVHVPVASSTQKFNPMIVIDNTLENNFVKLERNSHSLSCLYDLEESENDVVYKKKKKLLKRSKLSDENLLNPSHNRHEGYFRKLKNVKNRSKSAVYVNKNDKNPQQQQQQQTNDHLKSNYVPTFSKQTRPQKLYLGECDRNKLGISKLDLSSSKSIESTNSSSISYGHIPSPKVSSPNSSVYQFDDQTTTTTTTKKAVHFTPESITQENNNNKPGSEVLILISMWIKNSPNDFLGKQIIP
jgi:hypothetical protein